jgi:hypothetical protein
MTLTDYAYETIELVQRQLVDDFEISIRLVKDLIKDQRKLDFDRIIKGEKIMIPYTDLLLYAQAIKIPFHLEEDAGEEGCDKANKKWLRGTTPEGISYMNLYGSPAILFLFEDTGLPSAFANKINFVTGERAMLSGNGRFNSNQVLAFYLNNDLFITSGNPAYLESKDGKTFNVECVLEDPTAAENFDEDTDEYPIGPHWAMMQNYIVEKLLRKIQTPEDIVNDATDELNIKQ